MSDVSSTPLSEEEMAALVVAIELLVTPRRVLDENLDTTPPWRFSGRWFGSARFS